MFRRTLLCIAAIVLTGAARPAHNSVTITNTLFSSSAERQISSSLENVAKKNNLPSVALGIFIPGRGKYTFLYGDANLKTHTPRTLDQPFRVGSITKPFASMAVLTLVDRGLLRKNQAISKWFPDFPNAAKITVDDLLRMRSGIPSPNDDEVVARVYDAPLATAPDLRHEMASYAKLAAQFKPANTETVYSDFNYDVLAGIVAKITGKDMGQFITESVIAPLKLHDTSYPTGTSVPGPLRGYGWDPATKRYVDMTLFNPPLAGAAGAVISTVDDLSKFARVLCTGGLLKPQTHAAMLRGQPFSGTQVNYGEGVVVERGFCGHTGTINGFSTEMYHFKSLDATFVISVNRLDRDNRVQSAPLLAIVQKTLLSGQGLKR